MPAARHASFSADAAVGQAISRVVTGIVSIFAFTTVLIATMDASSEVGSESGRKKVRRFESAAGAAGLETGSVLCAAAGASRRPIGSMSPIPKPDLMANS